MGTQEGQDITIASEDGQELYVFASSGRHLRTVHALTQAPLYTFAYDGQGLLSSVTDASGNVTTIERDGDGVATAITDPYGRSTTLAMESNGFLGTVTSPLNETFTMSYDTDGLLQTLTNPRGGEVTVTYDDLGRVLSDQDAAGATMTFAREGTVAGWTVTRSTALGRSTTYETQREDDGSRNRINTFPSGAVAAQQRAVDEAVIGWLPDGTEIETTKAADPRWGINAPVVATTTRLPSSLERVTTRTRNAALSNRWIRHR